jgi:HlyD family secretion protein
MISLRTMSGRLTLLTVFCVTVVVTLLLIGCSGGGNNGSERNNERLIPAVEAVQARYGSLPLSERLTGKVKAKNQVELYPQISAAVVRIYVRNGDMVKSGDPLVKLRDTEYREQLKQAEANYRIALAQAKQAEAELQRMRAELKRSTNLARKDLISPTELETIQTQTIAAEANAELAQARVEQAQATVEQRKEELSRTIVRAPVEGTVGNRNVEIGMLVTSNTRLFMLGQMDSIRVEVVLTDRMLSYIEEGQRTEVFARTIRSGPVTVPVARISPFLHPVTHSTIAEIDLANPGGALKPGMFVTVDIFYGESEQATLVPLSALWENPVTASIGVFVCRDSLTGEPVAIPDDPRGGALTDPVLFQFVPVEAVARGRMNAGVRGIDPSGWVVTIGQDLLGSDTARARVRLVNWEWVEELQKLQREDLLEETMKRQRTGVIDSSHNDTAPEKIEGVS